MKFTARALLSLALVLLIGVWSEHAFAFGRSNHAEIVVVMVWDGLRPDFVNSQDTPTLDAMAHDGVLFLHHHSVYPTLTMVNATALATGEPPGVNGILGNAMDFAWALKNPNQVAIGNTTASHPIELEHTDDLAELNGPKAFDGNLVAAPTIAQDVLKEGGYVAIVGKQGPTFIFDARALSDGMNKNLLFIPGDKSEAPPIVHGNAESAFARDAWYTRQVIDQALPAAKAAYKENRPALVLLWQHDPDLMQHVAGLGTAPAIEALHHCDNNLARLREAIRKSGLSRHTDLVVVSDHGFATIKMMVGLSDLLVNAGLKRSPDTDDIVVVRNGGSDFVYLSKAQFPNEESRRAMLARIVDFAAAQDWSGPLFSYPGPPAGSVQHDENLGWIPGTFSEKLLGIYSSSRSPDLVISFREFPDQNNSKLTGPGEPSFALTSRGQVLRANHSAPLVHPVDGIMYGDSGSDYFTTGMGMHGAAGQRELHNFLALDGPDFKRHLNDADPSGNLDLAPTIARVFDLHPAGSFTGRVLHEALANGAQPAGLAHQSDATAYLVIQGAQIVSTLRFSNFDGENYLDSSSVTRGTIGPPQ